MINYQLFSGFRVLLSLLSPVLSLKFLQQLVVNQSFANFSDSSDSKNRETFSYVYYVNGEPTP